uniref:Uncharacterized protein n=1 Tax=Arundo donax TaxID=35708 RepID=A0A0A9AVH0_ARUDO
MGRFMAQVLPLCNLQSMFRVHCFTDPPWKAVLKIVISIMLRVLVHCLIQDL